MCITSSPQDLKSTMLRWFCCCKILLGAGGVLVAAGAVTLIACGLNTGSRDECVNAVKTHCNKQTSATRSDKAACAMKLFGCATKGNLLECPGVNIADGDLKHGCDSWNDRVLSANFHFRGRRTLEAGGSKKL